MKTNLILTAVVTLLASSLFADEISNLQSKIEGNYQATSIIKDMQDLNTLFIKNDREKEALAFYKKVQYNNPGKTAEAVAICLSVPILMRKDKYEEVVQKCVYVKETFRGSSWAAEALYNLGELYLNTYMDKTTSDKYFQELIRDCPKSGLVGSAKIFLGEQ